MSTTRNLHLQKQCPLETTSSVCSHDCYVQTPCIKTWENPTVVTNTSWPGPCLWHSWSCICGPIGDINWGYNQMQWRFCMIFWYTRPGELTVCNGKSPFLMGKSTISMAIFNSKLLVHQRVAQSLWGSPRKGGSFLDGPFLGSRSIHFEGSIILTRPKMYGDGFKKGQMPTKTFGNQRLTVLSIIHSIFFPLGMSETRTPLIPQFRLL